MSRRTRWILLALLVVLVGGVAVLVLTQQPKLDDACGKVDDTWKPLVAEEQLPTRYRTLEGALSAFDAAGGAERDVSKDLHPALAAWARAVKNGSAVAQVKAANAVEAQGARLLANVLGSERLKTNAAVTDALVKYAQTFPNGALVTAYNTAVREYEDTRTDALAQPVARALGFDARPVLVFDTGNNTGNA